MKKRIKILFVYHVSTVGGGSYCLLNILKELDKSKYEPVVLLREHGPLAEELNNMGIKTLTMPNLRTVPYNCSALTPSKIARAIHIIKSFSTFKKILISECPKVVYINSMMLYPYLRVTKRMNNSIGTIIHIREHWEEGSHRIQRGIAISHIARYADEIIAINRYSASMLEKVGRTVTIVYDWIDLSKRYQPMPMATIFKEDCSNLKVFMYMGGLQQIKGALEVLSSFSKLERDDYRLLVLGINSEYKTQGVRSFIKHLLSRIGYPSYSEKVFSLIKSDKRIKCIPGTYYVKDLYDQVYCILSYFTIPHANLSLAESVIEGTVNIAALTPESLEYSRNGELAILFEENNLDSFNAKIREIDTLHHIVKSRLRDGAKDIEHLFDTRRNASLLQGVYSKLTNDVK